VRRVVVAVAAIGRAARSGVGAPSEGARNNFLGAQFQIRRKVKNMRTAEDYGLDDSAVQVMGRAFDIACARLSRTGMLRPGNMERMQKLAAQQLVMYARRGERNEWRLARRAIFAVCAETATERLAARAATSHVEIADAAAF
jgi:hypothetical protein